MKFTEDSAKLFKDCFKEVEFVIGHTCLTTLFVTLACTYSAVLLRALARP